MERTVSMARQVLQVQRAKMESRVSQAQQARMVRTVSMARQVLQVQRAKMASRVYKAQQARMVRTVSMARQVLRVQRAKMASRVYKAQQARMVRTVSMARQVLRVLKGPRGIEALLVRISERVLGISPHCSICQKGQGSTMRFFDVLVTPLSCRLTDCEARKGLMRY
jgi:outer membrane lipoprotein SlyB